MTGLKTVGGIVLGSGGLATTAQIMDPKELAGLGVPQLFALVALVAIGALCYIVMKFIPVLMKLAAEISTLVAMLKERPCILDDQHSKKK